MTPRRARLRSLPTFADQAKAFGAVDAMLMRLGDGWVHAIQGEPVFRNPPDGVWYSMAPAMEGWISFWARLDAHYRLGLDLDPLRRIARRLAAGTAIDPDLVRRAVAVVTACKRAYRRMDVSEVRSLANTELIAHQVQELGMATEPARP